MKKANNSPENQLFKILSKPSLHGLIIVLCVLITFSPVLNNDFVNMDDYSLIKDNPAVTNVGIKNIKEIFISQFASPNYKPLTYLSWIVEYKIFGMSPRVYHLNNLLLHIINSFFVYLMISRMANFWKSTKQHKTSLALFTALLFALSPLRVESVAWAVERKDVLFSFFYLLGILSYFRFMKGRAWYWLVITFILYGLSVLSKSAGITLPAVLLLFEISRNKKIGRQMFSLFPMILIMGIGFVVFGLFTQGEDQFNALLGKYTGSHFREEAGILQGLPLVYQTFLLICFRIVFFIGHQLAPLKLSIVYPKTEILDSFGFLLHVFPILLFAIAFLLFRYRAKAQVFIWASAFYLISLSPVLAMPTSGTNFLSDRYTYLPSIALFFALTYAFLVLVKRLKLKPPFLKFVPLFLLTLIFAIGTFSRCKDWKNSETLFSDMIKKYPNIALGYNNRAVHYEENNQLDLALNDLNQALVLDPNFTGALLNRGGIYFKKEQTDKALNDFNRLINLSPEFALAYSNRGAVYGRLNEAEKAMLDFDKAIDLEIYSPFAYLNKAKIYVARKDYENALINYDLYLRFHPEDAEINHKRGVVSERLGLLDESMNYLNKAIQLDPSQANYYISRSKTWFLLNNNPKALEDALKGQSMGAQVNAEYIQLLQN